MEVVTTLSTTYVGDTGWKSPKCANVITSEGPRPRNCNNRATQTCSGCYLVMYCGRECQLAHRSQHKKDCRSSFLNFNWKPGWVADGRIPSFITSSTQPICFGPPHYLWGNVPAINTLNISGNEGNNYDKDLALCFAASGDLRNVLCSIIGTPAQAPTLCCIVNDRDQYVVARNVILLLIAMCFPATTAAELMTHLWYSAHLTGEMLKALKTTIRPFIADMINKIQGKREDTLLSKRWRFGSRQLVVLLYKEQWIFLLKFMDSRHSPAHSEAQRRYVVLNINRRDYVDRYLFRLPPNQRICHFKFRETGILLPLGTCLEEYSNPNPLLFEPQNGRWLQMDSADPLNGWSVEAVRTAETTKIGPSGDHIAHLYYYIRNQLTTFCQRIEALKVEFYMYQVDALQLPPILQNSVKKCSFDRIEVSNIVDRGRLGLGPVLSVFGPLLKTRQQNPHACLITLFINAIPEHYQHTTDAGRQQESILKGIVAAQRFIRDKPQAFNQTDPIFLRLCNAANMVWDYDKLLLEYLREIQAVNVGHQASLKMKNTNSIVDRWPLRLKKRRGEDGALEAFEDMEASNSAGGEFYLEWVRKTAA